MSPYIFRGIVLPERAPLTYGPLEAQLHHLVSGQIFKAKLNINLNQVTVYIYSEFEWNIFDLRNIVINWVDGVCCIFGFLLGYAYHSDIRQVIQQERSIDYVFGIDVPCINKREHHLSFDERLSNVKKKSEGEHGVYIQECLSDLNKSLTYATDTGFYCYRALESLRQFCRSKYGIKEENDQWKKLSELTGFGLDDIKVVKEHANPRRHGDISVFDEAKRSKIFTETWNIIEAFINNSNA